MKLLLTGATGFVGRNLLIRAIREGQYREIVTLVRSPEKLRAQLIGDGFDNVPEIVKPIPWRADLNIPVPIRDCDHVVHCAGLLFGRSEEEYFASNVQATLSLLHQVGEAKKIVILSSQAAAGPSLNNKALKETDPMNPISAYGRSKLEMERRVRDNFFRLPFIILRPPMILGARDLATLPLFKLARSPIRPKPGRQLKWYSYVAVDDLIHAVMAVLGSSLDFDALCERSFFVCHDRVISDEELIRTAGESMGRWGWTVPVPMGIVTLLSSAIDRVPSWRKSIPSLSSDRVREIIPDRWVINSELFQKTFRWMATVELRKALTDAKEWYERSGKL